MIKKYIFRFSNEISN